MCPISFITRAGIVLKKHKTHKSEDGSPRYLINQNSPNNTYSLKTCLKDYTPIFKHKKHEKD